MRTPVNVTPPVYSYQWSGGCPSGLRGRLDNPVAVAGSGVRTAYPPPHFARECPVMNNGQGPKPLAAGSRRRTP
jgi:hypothetical protein